LPLNGLPGENRQTMGRIGEVGLVARINQVTGARGFWEFIEALIRDGALNETDIEDRLGRFARLDPEIVDALGANKLPSLPMRIVGRR